MSSGGGGSKRSREAAGDDGEDEGGAASKRSRRESSSTSSRASWRDRGIAILRKLMKADGAKAVSDGGARPDSLRESGGSGGLKAIIADIESGELDSAEAVETDVTGLLDDFINGFDEGEPLRSTASLLRDAWDKGWAGQEMPELPKASSAAAAAAAAAASASADGGGSNGSGSGGKAEWNKEGGAALLQKLMKHKEARPFLKPVNPAELGIDDYFDVIESPMDLGTVKQRLDKGAYAAPLEFAKDIRLTFRNAMTYNPEGDSVHAAARRLLNSFEDGYREVTQGPSASSGKEDKGGKDKDKDRDDDSDDDKAALPVNPDCRACMGKHVAHSCGRGKVVPASKGGGPGGPAAPPKPKVVTRVDPNHAAQYLHAVSESGWRGGALMLLQMIEEHESSWPFMGPFQGTDEEMRRYAATVKRPMDLSTVVEKIRGGSYARGGRKEFLRDIRGVFFNAMLVHTKEDEKYTMALELSDMFEEEWAAVMSINDRLQASSAGMDDYEGGGGGNDGRGGDDSAPKVDIAEVAAVARSSGSMWRTDCASCLDRLRQHPSSWAFLDGGGVSGGGLDLTTIGKNLEKGLYETSDLFADDVRSVFGAVGAGKGGAGGEVVTIAETMLKEFEVDWGQLSSKWATEVRLVGANGAGGSKLGGEEQTMLKRELAIKDKILTVVKEVASAVSGAAAILDEVKKAAGEYGHPAEFARDAHAALKKWGEAGGGGSSSSSSGSSAAALGALDDSLAKHLAYPKDGGVAGIVAKSALRGPSGERPPRWFSECERCLSDVAASPSSWVLAVCVDLSQPGWIAQLEACPRPMDILAISNKLDAGWYTGPSPFVMDLKHAISNAKRNLGSQKEAAMGIIDNLMGIANRSIVLRDEMDQKASERLSRTLTNNGSVEDVEAWLGSGIMLTETTTKACLDMLSELIIRPSSWPFRKSPSGGLEGLAGKLEAGSFASVLHFVAEFRSLLSPIIAAGGVSPSLAGAGSGGGKLPAKFGAGISSSGEPGEYVADEDETPRGIAKKLKVSADDLVQLNKPTYPKIFVNSRLLQGTVLQVPASHGDAGSSWAPAPPSESQPDVGKKGMLARAALGLLRYGEMRIKSLMAPPAEQKEPGAPKAPAAPAVKIRKGGKFLFTKMGKVMSAVRKTLEAMLKLDQAEAIMSFSPPTNPRAAKLPPAQIDINTVRVSLELGVYCNAEDAVGEVKQVLRDSYDRAGTAHKAAVKSLQEWFDKEVGDALALAMLPEGGENVSLAEKENMLRATAVLERSMKRPQCELFLEPVDPDEDGCPDYLDIIKEPMDFGTVKESLEAGQYGTIAEMCQHIRLVFSNAKTFNAEGSPIHNNALEAEELFEADLKEILNLSPEELVPPDADACCVCGLSRGMQPCQGACGRQIHGACSGRDDMMPLCLTCQGSKDPIEDGRPPRHVPEVLVKRLDRFSRVVAWKEGYDEHIPLPYGAKIESDGNTGHSYRLENGINVTAQPPAPFVPAAMPPRADHQGEYFCTIMCCWRPVQIERSEAQIKSMAKAQQDKIIQQRKEQDAAKAQSLALKKQQKQQQQQQQMTIQQAPMAHAALINQSWVSGPSMPHNVKMQTPGMGIQHAGQGMSRPGEQAGMSYGGVTTQYETYGNLMQPPIPHNPAQHTSNQLNTQQQQQQQQMAPGQQQITPGQMAPGQITPGQMAPGQQQITPGQQQMSLNPGQPR